MMKKKIVENAVKRLYQKPNLREGITDQFYIDKINEYNYNGDYLVKKVNFNTIFKELKIQPKEDYKGDPKTDLKLADDVIKEYFEEQMGCSIYDVLPNIGKTTLLTPKPWSPPGKKSD
jgi:hypothetical protein